MKNKTSRKKLSNNYKVLCNAFSVIKTRQVYKLYGLTKDEFKVREK